MHACADEVVPDSWRVKNANDIVTRVPSLLGYHHIGVEVQMFPDGQLTISRETSDDLREGAFAADIIPKIKGAPNVYCQVPGELFCAWPIFVICILFF